MYISQVLLDRAKKFFTHFSKHPRFIFLWKPFFGESLQIWWSSVINFDLQFNKQIFIGIQVRGLRRSVNNFHFGPLEVVLYQKWHMLVFKHLSCWKAKRPSRLSFVAACTRFSFQIFMHPCWWFLPPWWDSQFQEHPYSIIHPSPCFTVNNVLWIVCLFLLSPNIISVSVSREL